MMERLPGYDAWKLASPPEYDDTSLCGDCVKLRSCPKAGRDVEDCADFRVEDEDSEEETFTRPLYAGLIEVPEGKGVCVKCGRITPSAEIVCESCARFLERELKEGR